MRLHPEKPACPRSGNASTVKAVLRRRQTERGGKGCWDAKQLDRDWPSSFGARIASEPLCPREARVCALSTGEDRIRAGWRSGGGRRQAHFEVLVSHELYAGAPVDSAAGVAPEQRSGTYAQRMQQYTHLARLCGRPAIPLALLTQQAGATTTNTGCIDHTQTAITFLAVFLGPKRLPGWTAQRPIRLEREIGSGEAASFPGGRRGGGSIP